MFFLLSFKEGYKMKGKYVFVIGILLVFCLVSCTGKSALVGKWVGRFKHSAELELEFFKDGSLIIKNKKGDEEKGTWTASENGQLTLKVGGETETGNYKISGSVLTLISPYGDEETFKRKK
jgi:hypothetical protein